jgi:phenylalanyl-tRNA synthetase beta chain
LIAGDARAKHWREAPRPVDFFEVKSWCEILLEGWGIDDVKYSPVSLSYLHPGASATLSSGGVTLGWAGLIHPGIAKKLDIPPETAVAAFDLPSIAPERGTASFQELPRFPPVKRDLSLTMKKSVTWDQVEACARESLGETLEAIHPFDVFSGGSLASDEKSLAFSLMLRRADKTLTDAEADELIKKTVSALENKLTARLRT